MAKKVLTEADIVELTKNDAPEYGSDGWDDYVMSQFKEDELIEGAPLCHGLRRVSRNLLGQIMFSGIVNLNSSLDWDRPGRAWVVYQVTFLWKDGSTRVFSDGADVWHGNTDDLFCAHPVATASTRAEARVLRKALAIRKVAAEELTRKDVVSIVKGSTPSVKVEAPVTGESGPEDSISAAQLNLIDILSKKLDVNTVKFVASLGKDIKTINKKDASEIITKLNLHQQNGMDTISKEIVGYDPNWKSERA